MYNFFKNDNFRDYFEKINDKIPTHIKYKLDSYKNIITKNKNNDISLAYILKDQTVHLINDTINTFIKKKFNLSTENINGYELISGSLPQALFCLGIFVTLKLYKYLTIKDLYLHDINSIVYKLKYDKYVINYLKNIYLYNYEMDVNNIVSFSILKQNSLINQNNSYYKDIQKIYDDINDLKFENNNILDSYRSILEDIHINFNIKNIMWLDNVINKNKKTYTDNENMEKYDMTFIINILFAMYDYSICNNLIVDDLFISKTFYYMDNYSYHVYHDKIISANIYYTPYLALLNNFNDVLLIDNDNKIFDNAFINDLKDDVKQIIKYLFNKICSIILIRDNLYYIYDIIYNVSDKKYKYKTFYIDIEDNKFIIKYSHINIEETYDYTFYKYKEYDLLDNLFTIFVRHLFKNNQFNKFMNFDENKIDQFNDSETNSINQNKENISNLKGIKFFCVLYRLYYKIYNIYLNDEYKDNNKYIFPIEKEALQCNNCNLYTQTHFAFGLKKLHVPVSTIKKSCFFHSFKIVEEQTFEL